MKKMMMLILILSFGICLNLSAQDMGMDEGRKNSIETSFFMFIPKIYNAQYAYEFSPNNHLIIGAAYQNIRYDFGTTHAPSLILGYKRFIWKGLNAEYVLWPAYNSFYEKNEKKYYDGFELWNEFRLSYEVEFNFAGLKMFANPQCIVGFGLFPGNKPQSFKDYHTKDEPIFLSPNISLGFKF